MTFGAWSIYSNEMVSSSVVRCGVMWRWCRSCCSTLIALLNGSRGKLGSSFEDSVHQVRRLASSLHLMLGPAFSRLADFGGIGLHRAMNEHF